MSGQTLLHMDGRWLIIDGSRLRIATTRPKITGTAIIVSDFEGSVSNVVSLEGSPAHAVALIEKRLRTDGLIDNESKILIHKTLNLGGGYQSLYTAVPLEKWQQLFAWVENQPDHCLLVPLTSLLWNALRPGRGIVLHAGRSVVFVAALRHRIVYASVLAFSDTAEDLALTVNALGARVSVDLAEGEDSALERLEL